MYVPHTGMQPLVVGGGGALAPVCWLPASRSWRKIGTPIAIAGSIWYMAECRHGCRLRAELRSLRIWM
jgi:hypothetical protein